MWTVVALNAAAWLARIIPAVARDGAPAYLRGTGLPVNVVYVQDLALWLPLLAVAAAWLWRRRPWGYLLAGAGLVMWVLESVSIAVDQWYGHAAAPASPVASGALVPAFAVLAAIGLIPPGLPAEVLLAWRWQRAVGRGRPREDRHRGRGTNASDVRGRRAEIGGMKRIVILGGGTGGTLVANRLRRAYRPEAVEIIVVDRDADHVYQPGLLFVPFGRADVRRITRPRWAQLRSGISYCQARIDHVDVENDRVYLGERDRAGLRRADRGHRRAAAAGGDRRADRAGLAEGRLHLLHPRGRRGAAPGAGRVHRRPPGRRHRGHADQVPGGAAGVLLPRRRLLPPSRHQGPGRPHLRHAAGRRVHQAGGQPRAGRPAGRQGHRAGDRVQHRDRAGHG